MYLYNLTNIISNFTEIVKFRLKKFNEINNFKYFIIINKDYFFNFTFKNFIV